MSALDVRPRLAAPDAAPAELEPRLHAFAVDRLVDLGVPIVVGWALVATGQGAGVAVAGAVGSVVVLLLALAALLGARGTSPGLALTGLRVVRGSDLAPVGFAPALQRQAVLLVAGAPTFGIGWATLAWTALTDPQGMRRGWHDQLADALVVDPSPAPVVEAAPEVPQQIVNLTAMRLAPPAPEPARGRPATPPSPVRPVVPGAVGAAAPQPPTSQPPTTQAAAPATPPVATATPAAPGAPATPSAPPAPGAAAAVRRPGRRRAGVPLSGPPAAQPPVAQPPVAPAGASAGRSAASDPAAPGRDAAGTSGWSVRLDTGEELPIDGLTLLGRGPQERAGESVSRLVPLQSTDMSVSKTHAQLQVAADGTLVAMDRGSTNGSVVVRRGVPRHLSPGRPTTLLDGDVLRLGDRTLEVCRRG